MPTTNLIILGRSHIAQALARVGKSIGYEVTVVVSHLTDADHFPEADHLHALDDYQFKKESNNDYIVVCTQGEKDEEMLQKAIEANPRYLSFVSSRKKSDSILRGLKKEGKINVDQLRKVKTPAGIDINAKEPGEVAISILAEIIKEKRSFSEEVVTDTEPEITDLDSDLYINPVCKIPVQKSTAKHVLVHEGEKIYFCCDGCKDSFVKQPDFYMKNKDS